MAPHDNIIAEAPMFREEVVMAELELKKTTRLLALRSLNRGPRTDWWAEGEKCVRIVAG